MAKHRWIKKAVSGAHGQFKAKAEAAGKSTREFAAEHAGDSGKTGKQARLAETLMGMHSKAKSRYASGGAVKSFSSPNAWGNQNPSGKPTASSRYSAKTVRRA